MSRKDFWKLVLLSSVISAGLVLFFLRWPSPPPIRAEFSQNGARTFDTQLTDVEKTNIQIYETLGPGVVNVTSITVDYNFWLQPIPREGVGSGFFIDTEGHIATNFTSFRTRRSWKSPFTGKPKATRPRWLAPTR